MTERKLATVRQIDSIRPIEGADAIECAMIGGWPVVVRKGEYQVENLVVYLEIDSWVPTDLAPFLTKPGHFPKVYEGVQGERLRTVKLRGQLSQGLLLPMSVLEPFSEAAYRDSGVWPLFEPGDDVTVVLNILKWEPPAVGQLAGDAKGNFPRFIQKTDQERIQNLKGDLRDWEYSTVAWEITEKLDGSSMTVFLNGDGDTGEFGVCSRNLELKEDEGNTFWSVARRDALETKLRETGRSLALQGELVGPGIQKNRYGLKEHAFYVFDIFDITTQKKLAPKERLDILTKIDVQGVPLILIAGVNEFRVSTDTNDTMQNILTFAEGKSVLNRDVEREGLVFKKLDDGGTSFKAISNKFLLKGGD